MLHSIYCIFILNNSIDRLHLETLIANLDSAYVLLNQASDEVN